MFSLLKYRYLVSQIILLSNRRVFRKKTRKNIGTGYFVRNTENYKITAALFLSTIDVWAIKAFRLLKLKHKRKRENTRKGL